MSQEGGTYKDAVDATAGLVDLTERVGGPSFSVFILGVVVGVLVTIAVVYIVLTIVQKEREAARARDLDREKELFKQINIKDERIEKLHEKLSLIQIGGHEKPKKVDDQIVKAQEIDK